MFYKLLYLIALCYSTQGIQITIENNFARDVYSSATYLPSGGISRLPKVIPAGEQAIVEINDEDLAATVQGLLILKPQGQTTQPISVAWEIPKTVMISGTNNAVAVYSGTYTNLQDHYSMLMDTNGTYRHNATDGWFDVSFADGSAATAFMASDSSSSILIVLQENKRFPSGEYYLQAYGTPYYMYRFNSTSHILEHFNPSDDTGFRWNITRQDSTLNYFYTWTPSNISTKEAFAYATYNFDTNAGVRPTPIVPDRDLGYFWNFKPAGRDLFVIQSRRFGHNIDISNCQMHGGSSLNGVPVNKPCTLGSTIALQPITDEVNRTNNRLWRLIPV